jgi:hypothetical protein
MDDKKVYCVIHDRMVEVPMDDDHWYVPATCDPQWDRWPRRGCAMQYESRGTLHTVIHPDQRRLIEAGGGKRP